MEALMTALAYVLQPYHIGVIFFGTLIGILVGAMPGLSSIMGLSIMMPLTLSLEGNAGILMLLGIFCGAIYGGSITAILIKTPGTANSAATVLDGYPMATKLGQPGRAIGISTMASTFGGLFSAVMLLWTAPLLSKFALKFGAAEYFALAMFGLSMVTSISSKNVIKGLIGAVIGLMLSTIGINSLTGSPRFTFGSVYLMGGIAMVPTLIALYAFSQGLSNIEDGKKGGEKSNAKLERILPTLADIKTTFPTILRSSVIGTVIGAIPGTGGDIASWVGYNEAKRWSKHPEKFGEGVPEGIAAPEAANNAISGGALIPLLTLGIPGDAGTAVMLSALMMQGVVPGPTLFTDQTGMVYTIIAGLFFANIAMCILGYAAIRGFAKIGNVSNTYLTPIVFVFCVVGTYALNNNILDIFMMMIFGAVAFFLIKCDFPMPPIILGLILGNLAEKNLQRALVISNGSISIFFTRPISLVLIIISVFSLLWPIIQPLLKKKSTEK